MPLNSPTEKLLKQAIQQRDILRKHTNAIRLVNGKGDGLEGLVLEQYHRHFLAQVFNKAWLTQMDDLRSFLLEHFQVDFFIVKNRTQSAASNPEAFQSQILVGVSSQTTVKENNIFFEVDLNDTLNTGLFLDMRSNRHQIAQLCKDKRVLNCFSYTCSFGVYAKAFRAKEVINVDISKKILDKGRRNYELNHLAIGASEFVKADATEYLSRAVKKDNRFDIIIIDPPSFARVGSKVFNIQKSLPLLISDALKVLNRGGKLFVSTNNSTISFESLEQMIKKASHPKPFKKLTCLGQDQDFPGTRQMKESYLVALLVEY